MKKIIFSVFVLLFVLSVTNSTDAKVKLKVRGGVYFHSELNPYGNWFKIRGGVTVWRPTNVRFSWQPYRNGRWFWTDDGWYWDSYEDFGFITFHYGRWYYDDYYGWVWIPGNRWAPAWVDWRYDDDYIGWAPLPPYAEFSIGIGLSFTNNFHYGYNHWHFVRYRNFFSTRIYNHFIGQKYKYRVYSRTKYRNNYGYVRGRVVNRGVDIKYVRKRSGNRIVTRKIKRVNNVRDIKIRDDKKYVRSYINPKKRVKTRNYNNTRSFINKERTTRNNKVRTRTRINRTERNKIYREKRTTIPKTRTRIERKTRKPEIRSRTNKNDRKKIIKRSKPGRTKVRSRRSR